MVKRRTALKGAAGVVAAFLVDPSGWLGSPTTTSALAAGKYDEFGGFVLLKPGQPRPPQSRQGPAIAVIAEPSGGKPPTVATIDLNSLSQADRAAGGLARVEADSRILAPQGGNRLVHVETGAIVMETQTFLHRASGRTVALTAVHHVPIPYAIPPLGNAEHGFATWERVQWMPRPGVAIGPGHVASGMWLDGDTLYRLEVVGAVPVGPKRLESVLSPVAAAFKQP